MESYLDGRMTLMRAFISGEEAAEYFVRLRDKINWLSLGHDNRGGRVSHPRLTAAYGERAYDYAGLKLKPEPWSDFLLELKAGAESSARERFNSVLMQFYRHGEDRVNWHSDNDPCVGRNPVIASLSFGAPARFQLRRKDDYADRLELELREGDLLVMGGDLQHTHDHRVPREPGRGPRINLTFRRIIDA